MPCNCKGKANKAQQATQQQATIERRNDLRKARAEAAKRQAAANARK